MFCLGLHFIQGLEVAHSKFPRAQPEPAAAAPLDKPTRSFRPKSIAHLQGNSTPSQQASSTQPAFPGPSPGCTSALAQGRTDK
ncbi:hypothetical protein PHLGIDRAFT_191707, partial [Phlebiopsis gigantea 11061_1 CR5-6]